jgi:hypothetical protein
MMVAKSSNSLRINWRGTGRPIKGLRNVHNTGVRGCPRGVAPLTHHPAMRDNPVVAYGRSNDLSASQCLVMCCPNGAPLFASSRWLLHTG